MLSRSGAQGGAEPSVLRRYAPVIAAFAVSRLVIVVAAVLVEARVFVANPRLTQPARSGQGGRNFSALTFAGWWIQ